MNAGTGSLYQALSEEKAEKLPAVTEVASRPMCLKQVKDEQLVFAVTTYETDLKRAFSIEESCKCENQY